MDEPTSSDLANLQREVSRLALAAGDLSTAQKVHGARLEVATRSVRRQRWILAAVVSVIAALVVVGIGVGYALHRQSCVNDRSNRFFDAERDKVSGQVTGLNELNTDPAAGVTQFREASQHYLDVIAGLPRC